MSNKLEQQNLETTV